MKFLTIASLCALAAAQSYPGSVSMSSVAFEGSGCPSTGKGPNVGLPYSYLLAVKYPRTLAAKAGDAEPIAAGSRSCQMSFKLQPPANWEYAISSIYYGGRTKVDAKVSATAQTTVRFQGEKEQATSRLSFPASTDTFYIKKENFDRLVWSGCNEKAKSLNFDYQVQLTPGGNGSIETDEVPQFIDVVWRQCQ